PSAARRRAARTVLDLIFERLTAWLAPILAFTMEEVWQTRFPERESVHLRLFPETPADWPDAALTARWNRIRTLRRVVTGALEIERGEKRIGAPLEAPQIFYLDRPQDLELMRGVDLAETAITSAASTGRGPAPAEAFRLPDVPDAAVVPQLAKGQKC